MIYSDDVREFLEGYGISSTILTDDWIDARIEKTIIPYVQRMTGMSFTAEDTITEYHDGGNDTIVLNRRPVNSIQSISYISGVSEIEDSSGVLEYQLDSDSGIIIKASGQFSKGIKNVIVTYQIGSSDMNDDINEALLYLTSELCLTLIANRTGGGDLSVQGIGKSYGPRGKWDAVRNDFTRQAKSILSKYSSGVI